MKKSMSLKYGWRTERRVGVRHDGDIVRERVQLVERLQARCRHHPYVGNPSGPTAGQGYRVVSTNHRDIGLFPRIYPNRISTETPPVAWGYNPV